MAICGLQGRFLVTTRLSLVVPGAYRPAQLPDSPAGFPCNIPGQFGQINY